MSITTLALVGCGNTKRSEPSEAQQLYTSNYFQKKRRWAEGCSRWRILSAEYGLVHPTTIIDPYDTAIYDLNQTEVEHWAKEVVRDLQPLVTDVGEIVFLAGEKYVQPIIKHLSVPEIKIHWPFEGKRIGEQEQWMGNNPPPNQSTFGSFE